MYDSIITHNDFDGIVCAVLCSFVFHVDRIKFAGPSTIARAEIPITERDIVCDLPYPLECGLWFDHHEGNLQELHYRRIDPATINGKFELKPSCARVIFDYVVCEHTLPSFFSELVDEADIIDAFDYPSVDEWRKETPGKIIDAAIKLRTDSFREKNEFLRRLVEWLKKSSISEVARNAEIANKYAMFQAHEKEMLTVIEQNSYFLAEDTKHELLIIDLTNLNQRPQIIKNLAYLLHPETLAVLEVSNSFKQGVKSTDLNFSISLSINLNQLQHSKNVGEIIRDLNIGDGHPGAASGKMYCTSKNEMIRQKEQTIRKIFTIWQAQN